MHIFLDPQAFEPVLSKRGINRELKTLRDAVDAHPALTFINEESRTIGGFGRSDPELAQATESLQAHLDAQPDKPGLAIISGTRVN